MRKLDSIEALAEAIEKVEIYHKEKLDDAFQEISTLKERVETLERWIDTRKTYELEQSERH
jgi:predicted S18 family serine protease